MTRFLSEALEAPEPYFRLGLSRLEAANGHPGTDIRFSTAVRRETMDKLRQLGLDPHDTTPQELYRALQERVKADDNRLVRQLRTQAALNVSAEAQVIDGLVHVLKKLPDTKRCLALKTSKLKSLLKAVPPKRAMKRLGYRSLDSFLKHEAPLNIMTAAWLSEGQTWQRRLVEQYKQLKPSDFENRQITITQVNFKRWNLAEDVTARHKHNLLSFRELGALVLLPLPEYAPAGSVTVSLALALHELNEIRASSTFLKLSQVRPDFGQVVQIIVRDEPYLNSKLLDQAVPWKLVQRYYAKQNQHFQPHIFEPHIELEDMIWQPIENALSTIAPELAFWQDSAHLGLLHDHKPVSLNIVDAALNYCNQLPFEKRLSHYFQGSLWHELLLRYLQPEAVEHSVISELQPALVTETVT
jgi:hypothetical protein